MSINFLRMDRFLCLKCLNDNIDLPNMIRSPQWPEREFTKTNILGLNNTFYIQRQNCQKNNILIIT